MSEVTRILRTTGGFAVSHSLLLCLVLSCLGQGHGNAQTFENVSARDALTCLLTNAFDLDRPFSGVADIRIVDETSMTLSAGISAQAGHLRVYVDMSNLEVGTRALPISVLEARKKEGLSRLVVLMRRGDPARYVLYPERHTYHTNDFQSLLTSAEQSEPVTLKQTALGEETLDDHVCRKTEWQISDGKETKSFATIWRAADMKDFPLKLQLGTEITIAFRQPKFGPLEPAIFEIPSDYKCLNSIEAIAGEARRPPATTPPSAKPEPQLKPEERILKWQQELAEKGDPFGQLKMGLRYRDGDGVPKDLEKARELLQNAASQGNVDASAALTKLNTERTASPAQNQPKQIKDITIRSAQFGSGTRRADVTARVVELLRSMPDGFESTAQQLGKDPLPGRPKRLAIRYEYQGVEYRYSIQAPQRVSYETLLENTNPR